MRLGMEQDKVRVIAGDIGGSFGLKIGASREELAAAAASRELGRERFENTMAMDSVSSVGAPTAVQYSVSVAKKQQSQQDVEGQESVQLIQSASAPLATSGSVGTKLNVVGS